MRDTAQRSDCGKLLPNRGPPPDHLTHSHAAAEDATVDDAENSSPPEPPDASSPPQPTPDAADAEEFHAVAAKAAQMAAAATSQQPSIALSVWPGISVSGSKNARFSIASPDSPSDRAVPTDPTPPNAPPDRRVSLADLTAADDLPEVPDLTPETHQVVPVINAVEPPVYDHMPLPHAPEVPVITAVEPLVCESPSCRVGTHVSSGKATTHTGKAPVRSRVVRSEARMARRAYAPPLQSDREESHEVSRCQWRHYELGREGANPYMDRY